MTKLNAVNMMLRKVGEMPVNTLIDSGYSELSHCISILEETNRDVQSAGFIFNTDNNFELVPDVNGFIYPPSNILRMINVEDFNITIREGKLYDIENHTNVFTENVKVDLTLEISFEDIEHIYQQYIALKACLIFSNEKNVSTEIAKLISLELLDAEEKLIRYDIDNQNLSIWDDADLNKVNDEY